MVVALLQPAWLWGLLGLLVPIAIHLLHKRSSKVLLVGSLQPFRGGAPVQARRLRPNELWLLLLRCLLLALFVLLLTQPVWVGKEQPVQRFVFIAPELAPQLNADSLRQLGWEPRLLQPGLPPVGQEVSAARASANYWDVFQEIEGTEGVGDTVWLLFQPRLEHFSGERPALSKAYVGLPLPKVESRPRLLSASSQPREQLLLEWWEEEQGVWQIRQRQVPLADSLRAMQAFAATVPIRMADTLTISLLYAPAYEGEVPHWQRALQLADSLLPATALQISVHPAESEPAPSAVLIWLAEDPLPSAIRPTKEGVLLQLREESGLGWFRKESSQGGVYTIRKRVEAELHNRQALAQFVPELLEVLPLRESRSLPPALLPEEAWRPIRATQAAVETNSQSQPLEQWVLLALVLFFILERWLSLRT